MARGKKALPNAIKLLRGNPGKRPLKADLTPAVGVLAPPAWLSPLAREHWIETVPVLARYGLFTELDRMAWAIACSAWGHARELGALIQNDGMVITGDDGIPKLHPALRYEEKWWS